MFQALLVIAVFYLAKGCPEVDVPPCKCRLIGTHARIITCTGAENDVVLQKSLLHIKRNGPPLPIRAVEIFESTLNYIPSKLFTSMQFPRLFIAGCTIGSLSDSDDVGFVGLEHSLETLIVQESNIYSGWRWSHLKNLKALSEFRTIKAGPIEVDDEFKEIAHLNITKLELTQDSVSYVHSTAFATFHNMETLSLKRNEIEKIERSMFPDPAYNLQQIILSYNKLKNLPKDLFTNMPALKSISFSNNNIITLDKFTVFPVWNHLKKFDFSDNPIRCDCRMRWILDGNFPLNTWMTCNDPKALKGKSIKDVQLNELWC